MEEAIRAEDPFHTRAKIDKNNASKARPSPDVGQMYGAKIVAAMSVGGEKTSYYYWETKERRDDCLPRILRRFSNPEVTLIGKK